MTDIQVIKYEGDNSTFVWKHPQTDFSTGSQLIVHESQEALFFMNGQALDLFTAGRHTLSTQNLPLINKFFKLSDKETSPFHCEVYFINKVEQMAIRWGTDSRIEYVEPTYNFPINIGASGEMSLRVDDSRKLIVKVVGTERSINQQMLVQKFRGFLMTHVKTHLVSFIQDRKINIFSIDQHLTEISTALQAKLAPDFSDYGVALDRFFVTTIVKPEDDRSYQKFKDLHFRQYADVTEAELRQKIGLIDQTTEAQRMVIEAQGKSQKRAVEGYSYEDERKFDVAEKIASNEASGQVANLGIGLGMMAGVGGTVGAAVGGLMKDTIGDSLAPPSASSPSTLCSNCGKPLPAGAKFCPECGAKVTLPDQELITCPKCGAKTPKGKFCIECGAPLISKCQNCGAELPANVKFCPECGQKI